MALCCPRYKRDSQCPPSYVISTVFKGTLERSERGRAMHAGQVLCAQSSLGNVYAGSPTPDPQIRVI